MERIGQVSSVVAAVAGLLGVLLWTTTEWEGLRQWEIWDNVKPGLDPDAKLVIADLRHDNGRSNTEDVIRFLKGRGVRHYELKRTWKRVNDNRTEYRKRRELLDWTQALALVEGYVGAKETVLHIWARGETAPAEYTVKGELGGDDRLAAILEEEMVKGIRNEASSKRMALLEDFEYERMLKRARQTRRQLQGEEAKQQVDFVIAFIENIRADGAQGEEAGQAALRIYRRVIEQTNDEAERMRALGNLAIAEFRVAKKEKNLQRAELAISYWKQAENLAEKIGQIDVWATTRSWQTEGDLFIYEITGNSTRLARALKRQVETVEDTQGLIVDDVLFRAVTFLQRASREWGRKHSRRRCDGPPTRLIAFRDIIGEEICETVHLIDWTDGDYVRRRDDPCLVKGRADCFLELIGDVEERVPSGIGRARSSAMVFRGTALGSRMRAAGRGGRTGPLARS